MSLYLLTESHESYRVDLYCISQRLLTFDFWLYSTRVKMLPDYSIWFCSLWSCGLKLFLFCNFFSQAHNRNLLSIDFDQSTRVGKIYDDHRKFTLHIQYDILGRPVVWSPSSKYTEVNVSYSGGGLLSAIHRGEWFERLKYENDKVVSRAWVNGKIWSYTYIDRVRPRPHIFINTLEYSQNMTWKQMLMIRLSNVLVQFEFNSFVCHKTRCKRTFRGYVSKYLSEL